MRHTASARRALAAGPVGRGCSPSQLIRNAQDGGVASTAHACRARCPPPSRSETSDATGWSRRHRAGVRKTQPAPCRPVRPLAALFPHGVAARWPGLANADICARYVYARSARAPRARARARRERERARRDNLVLSQTTNRLGRTLLPPCTCATHDTYTGEALSFEFGVTGACRWGVIIESPFCPSGPSARRLLSACRRENFAIVRCRNAKISTISMILVN